MIFAALTFWLLAITFTSFGVQHLWAGATKSRLVTLLLAPGLIVHEMSHVLACLLTGATVKEASLFGGGAAGRVTHTKPAVPIVGQALISLAPLIGCGASLWLSAVGVLRPASRHFALRTQLPAELLKPDAFAEYLVAVLRETFNAVTSADFGDWRTYLFLYLATVLVIHMSPSRRDLRSGVASLIAVGLLLFALGQIEPAWLMAPVRSAWPFLTLCLALVLFVLLMSLLVIGLIRLTRLMLRPG